MTSLSEKSIEDLLLFAYNQSGEKGAHITRLIMNNALNNKFSNYDSSLKTCLAISDSKNLAKILGLSKTNVTEANYPKSNMLNLKFSSDKFDFCISDQVLEHIEGDPFLAFSESARVIKSGGLVCHTTCFINEIHGYPKDFWRYTVSALNLMAKHSGLETVLTGQWGNREVQDLIQNMSTSKFRFMPVPKDQNNPINKLACKNEADWPITVWIIARKN